MRNSLLNTNRTTTPEVVIHHGNSICIVKNEDPANPGKGKFFYSVLSSQSIDNDLANEYTELELPTEQSILGYNLLRTKRMVDPPTSSYFKVLSDQKYVYLFFNTNHTLYVCRYMAKETKNAAGNTSIQLEPAWEVRFKRSKKPDSPYNDTDVPDFIDMQGQPFMEPLYAIALGKESDLNINGGAFSVELVPTSTPNENRWQLFAVNSKDERLYIYSFGYGPDNWFQIAPTQYDPKSGDLLPDCILDLYAKEGDQAIDLRIKGIPSSLLYNKKEPASIKQGGHVNLSSSYKIKLMVPVMSGSQYTSQITDIDFCINNKGYLIFPDKKVSEKSVRYEVGYTEPVDCSISFNGGHIDLPYDSRYTVQSSFIQQLWVYPRNEDTSRHYLIGPRDSATQPPLAAVWIEYMKRVGFGFTLDGVFYGGESLNDVLKLNVWNNITVAFDGSRYELYVNGTLEEIKQEANKNITGSIRLFDLFGNGYNDSRPYPLAGYIDDVRIWKNADSLKEALACIHREITDEEVQTKTDLLGYWKFFEGSGKIASNSSSYKGLDGTLVSANWESAHSPIKTAMNPKVYVDKDSFMSLDISVIDPQKNPAYPQFIQMNLSSRVFLLNSADGRLHAYYKGLQNDFYKAIYDPLSVKAVFGIPCMGECEEKHHFDFISRQAGSLANQANIQITRDSNPYLCTLLITDGSGYAETWKGVPANVHALIQVINGQAVTISGYAGETGDTVFYDYSGKQRLAYQPYGGTKTKGQLLFIAAGNPDCQSMTVQCDAQGEIADITFLVNEGGKEHTYRYQSVPTDVKRFVLTLQGFNTNYPYTEEQRKISSAFNLHAIGSDGQVGSFNLELSHIQGVKVEGGITDVSTGSNLFVAYSDQQGEKAHDEFVDFGDKNSISAELHVFGQDGGWITQSPKQDIYIPFRGALQVPVENPIQAKSFDITDDLTMETWVRGGNHIVKSTSDYEYQRIFHAHPFDDVTSSCMIGVNPSNCMHLMYRTKIEAVNCGELFSSSVYSVMMYIKPNKNTLKAPDNRIFTRFITPDNYETLCLDSKGFLLLRVVESSKTPIEINSNCQLDESQWWMVAYTRDQQKLILYINGKQVATKTNVPSFSGAKRQSESIYLGGNVNPSLLEARISNFTIWNREMTEKEVKDRYMKYPPIDSDGLALFWEMSDKTNSIRNIASKNVGKYDGSIYGDYMWNYPGLFCRAFGATGEKAIFARDASLNMEQWNHISFHRQMVYGIRTGGVSSFYGQCLDASSFNTPSGFTIAGWIMADKTDKCKKQALFSKFSNKKENRSFEFGLSLRQKNDLYVILSLRNHKGLEVEKEFYTSSPVNISSSSFIAVSVKITPENRKEGEGEKTTNTLKTKVNVYFYVDGKVLPATFSPFETEEGMGVKASTVPVCLGRTRPDGQISDQSYFSGKISSFSFFSEGVDSDTLQKCYTYSPMISGQKTIVSHWDFREQKGTVAKDQKGNNDLYLSQDSIWCRFEEASHLFLSINGKIVDTEEDSVYRVGGYGDSKQIRFGNRLDRGVSSNIFNGEINEFRLWSIARTPNEITENMYSYLTGKEKGLNAYWNFESEAGDYAVDLTGNGNEAIFVTEEGIPEPEWKHSNAPQNNEMPFVINAIGGKTESSSIQIDSDPAVFEYACTERDPYGTTYSLMKRGYIYSLPNQGLTLSSGFKIGDLKRVYMGQVQSDPTIIGFIEGTPPIPSENQTSPHYQDPTSSDYFAYDNTSSITLTEEKGLEVSLSSSKETIEKYTISTDDYMLTEIEFDYGTAMGALFSQKTFTNHVEVGGHYDEDIYDNTVGDSRHSTTRLTSKVTNQLSSPGDWEELDKEGNYLIPGKRRYIPRNEGLALVKSSTVDAYMLILEKTNMMVGMSYELNRDIPEDMNYINFRINPLYIKNGTLDGKVGLYNDENYPNADLERGSYFKPVESYSLKKEIERKNHELAVYYAQFGTGKISDLKNNDSVTGQFATIEFYDQVKEQFKKDIVNEYIWTASGGLYSQSDSYISSIQESYSGNYSKGHDDTGGFAIEFTCFIGAKSENLFTHGHHWTLNIEKNKNMESSIGMDISVNPDSHLGSLIKQGDDSYIYSPKPEPGKVDTYRFNTFYLASSKDNYQALFSTVIDPVWLNSDDPNAKILRQAQPKADGSAYRVLYRVTYVNRIAPEFQRTPLESNFLKKAKPSNLTANTLLLTLVDEHCKGDIKELGRAITQVINNDLVYLIPQWDLFLEKASTYNSPEYIILTQLKEDTADYMHSYYSTLN